MVSVPDAIVKPGAMMVKSLDTTPANHTVP